MNRKGFTLIELLVVIAIIAILAAILFPVFTAARESGRVTKCAANLRQISRALEMYRDLYNGRNCYIWQNQMNDDTLGFDQGSFYWVITRYVGQKMDFGIGAGAGEGNKTRYNVYKCPSAPWLRQKWGETTGIAFTNEGFAYTMNETGYFTHGRGGIHAGGGLTDSQYRRPTQIIFVAEGMGWVGYGVGYGNGSIFDNENPQKGCGNVSDNPLSGDPIPLSDGHLGLCHGSYSKIYNIRVSHNGGANLLFYDGHIACLKMTYGRNWSVYY